MTLLERMFALIEYCVHIDVLNTDRTSILFVATLEDGRGTRRHKGVFYPAEWQLVPAMHDDFELETEEYEVTGVRLVKGDE